MMNLLIGTAEPKILKNKVEHFGSNLNLKVGLNVNENGHGINRLSQPCTEKECDTRFMEAVMRKPFTKSLNKYKEYLAEFWYSATALENSKVSFSIPTCGIYGEVRVNTFRNAIGAHYLPHSSEYVAPPSIDMVRQWFPTIRYGEEVFAKGTLRKSLLPPRWSLVNGINIDYANIFWEHIIIKLNKRHMEKVVPYTRFLSLLMMHKMKEGYGDGELTLYPTQVFSVSNWTLKPNQPEEPLFIDHMLAICSATEPVHSTSSKQPFVSSKEAIKGGSSKAPTSSKTGHSKKRKESILAMDSNPRPPPNSTPVNIGMHKEDQQATAGPTSLGVTSEARVNPQLSSGMSAFNLNEPIYLASFIIHSESASGNDASAISTAEVDPGKSTPNDFVPQQQKQLHKLEMELPGDLKEILSKLEDFTKTVTSLTSQVAELKTLQWELPAEFLFVTSQVEMVQSKLKTLDTLPIHQKAPLSLRGHIKKDNGKKAMSLEEADKESINSDSDDETHMIGSMVETSRIKKAKKYDFVTEDGMHIHLTKEQINQQKKIDEEAKAKVAKQEEEVRKAELVDLLGINLDIPLREQDPLDKLNNLANKKRKHADDIHDYFKANKRLKSSVQYEDHLPDLKEFSNTMLYTVQEIFFRHHQGLGLDDHARTFSSILLAEVKRNLNPLKQMRVIKQLRQ
ncbi:hypothetical protein Tco_0523355 [Tanacetum coccineum]